MKRGSGAINNLSALQKRDGSGDKETAAGRSNHQFNGRSDPMVEKRRQWLFVLAGVNILVGFIGGVAG
jgi:hypothetical protein